MRTLFQLEGTFDVLRSGVIASNGVPTYRRTNSPTVTKSQRQSSTNAPLG